MPGVQRDGGSVAQQEEPTQRAGQVPAQSQPCAQRVRRRAEQGDGKGLPSLSQSKLSSASARARSIWRATYWRGLGWSSGWPLIEKSRFRTTAAIRSSGTLARARSHTTAQNASERLLWRPGSSGSRPCTISILVRFDTGRSGRPLASNGTAGRSPAIRGLPRPATATAPPAFGSGTRC